jgi:transposase
MELLNRRCCRLDVHKETVVACLRLDRISRPKCGPSRRSRRTLRLSDWLATSNCTHVAMEATGVYWKPV